jgi:hypothetical protein
MRYVSTCTWRDLTDGHLYLEGEPFPFDGREIDPGRLERLLTGTNRAGLVPIKEVEEPKAQEPEKPKEVKPAKPKTPRKTTKK